jgi:hypothetical protein
LRKGARDGLAILLVYASPAVLRGRRELCVAGGRVGEGAGSSAQIVGASEIQSEYSTGMNQEQKSDTAQVLWMDAAVVLIIALIAIVTHHGR